VQLQQVLQFAAIYPMSPISNILHTLAQHQMTYGYVYKQPEDEISAINMAIGASFAGARSMTATSGGGFCLMAEGYGLAGITETPLVIIEGMRGGPATGLPTWSSQGDLQFVLHAHQDEFPRIVLAAGDVEDAFYMTMEAFYIADKYQTPVVVLLDKNICDDEESVSV
jgi:2-oxoglutarate/2-oxoacid ferredoxin oxidoreductase subunit alpha